MLPVNQNATHYPMQSFGTDDEVPPESGKGHTATAEKSGHPSSSPSHSAPPPDNPTPAQSCGLPEFLSPQSLVAYCDSRLSSLDSEMQQIFNQQQLTANTTTALSQVADDLNNLPQATGDSSSPTISVTAAQAAKIQSDYLAAINAAKAQGTSGSALAYQLEEDLRTFLQPFAGNPNALALGERVKFPQTGSWSDSASSITNLSQNLKTDGSDIDSDSQMGMINLQSLMSQQQTAVELSTNMIQTLSQTAQNIAANMKNG
jgi:hypothetical protein